MANQIRQISKLSLQWDTISQKIRCTAIEEDTVIDFWVPCAYIVHTYNPYMCIHTLIHEYKCHDMKEYSGAAQGIKETDFFNWNGFYTFI